MRRRIGIVALTIGAVAGLAAQQQRQEFTLFASAARTATATGDPQYAELYRGVALTLNVTAASGTPTLDVKLQGQDQLSGTWVDISGAVFQQITTTGTRTLTVYPSPQGLGTLRSLTGTDPAVNVEISETVPVNTRWRLVSVGFIFVTDATVANRVVNMTADDGTTVYMRTGVGAVQAASTTNNYGFSGVGANTTNSALAFSGMLPAGLMLAGGHKFNTATQLLQATDNYGAPTYLVEEWIGNYAAMPLPRVWRAVATIGGGTPSLTFTLAGVSLP